MDAGVYDHIQAESLKRDEAADGSSSSSSTGGGSGNGSAANEPAGTLATDLQETYKSFTASPWGAKLGGLWGTVNKQAQSYIQEAQKEASAAGQSAFKGFNDLRSTLEGRARSLSNELGGPPATTVTDAEKAGDKKETAAGDAAADGEKAAAAADTTTTTTITEDGGAFIERFRNEAARRLADLQHAEDAADEALLKFGTNIRNFLRDAVTVTAPTEAGAGAGDDKKDAVLFESKDADGKRVIHTTRFDAQLHVIHCSLDSFTKDPASPEYAKWEAEGFDVEKRTDDIARDLDRYEELRRAMEKLVPEKVDYPTFWKRYYFLRMVIESEEKRRREMLKAAASKSSADDADLAWDEDSDEEGPSTPQPRGSPEVAAATSATPLASSGHLKEPRKSHDEKSTAGSESSYDLVSGATSAAPGSPQEKKEDKDKKKDDSDEEDWE